MGDRRIELQAPVDRVTLTSRKSWRTERNVKL